MLRDLPSELLPRPREVAQLLDRGRRDEAAADQSVCCEIREPCGIVHVALPTRNCAHVPGIRQDQRELRLQDVPHRLPIHAGRFQRDDLALVRAEPLREGQQPT